MITHDELEPFYTMLRRRISHQREKAGAITAETGPGNGYGAEREADGAAFALRLLYSFVEEAAKTCR